MAKKQTDLLRDQVSMAQTRYQEQVDAFKAQYIPTPTNPVRDLLKQNGIDFEILSSSPNSNLHEIIEYVPLEEVLNGN